MLGFGFWKRSSGARYTGDPGTFDAYWIKSGVQISQLLASSKIKITTISAGTTITAIGTTAYSINGAAYTTSSGTIDPDDIVKVRDTSSGLYETAVNGGVVIGGVNCPFVLTTTTEPVAGFPYTFPFVLE